MRGAGRFLRFTENRRKKDRYIMSDSYKINFAAYTNGDESTEASIEKFEGELLAWKELQTKDQGRIGEACEKVFAANTSANMNKPAVVTMVLSEIGFTAGTYNALRERVETVIDETARYYTVKGKGGGLRRMSDIELAHFESTGLTPDVVARETAKADKAKAKAAK